MRKNTPPPPSYHDRKTRAKTRPYACHEAHPAGTKNVLRWFKKHHGAHAETVAEAWKWYRNLHAEKDAAARKAEQKRKDDRFRRRFPWLAHRLPEAA